jgi:hypothetical protein
MDDFFSSLVPFLIVAAFVGVRVASLLRRRRQRKDSAPAAPQKPARGFVPWENESRGNALAAPAGKSAPVPAEPAGDDEAFSAWNLSVDESPPVAPPRLPREPLPVQPPLMAQPERMAPSEPVARPRRPAPAASGPKLPFLGLPPLQRAVVWAEILGAPKGLG